MVAPRVIFSGGLCEKVLDGSKTQTRRPVKYFANGHAPCRYTPGHDYAVQPGRGQTAVGRLRVLSTTRVTVADISHADALAEGFTSRRAFLNRWRELYGHASGWCWRIEFERAA